MASNSSTLKDALAFLLVFSGSYTFLLESFAKPVPCLTLLTFVFPPELFLFSLPLLVKSSFWVGKWEWKWEGGQAENLCQALNILLCCWHSGIFAMQAGIGRAVCSCCSLGNEGQKLSPSGEAPRDSQLWGNGLQGQYSSWPWALLTSELLFGRGGEWRGILHHRFVLLRADFIQSLAW